MLSLSSLGLFRLFLLIYAAHFRELMRHGFRSPVDIGLDVAAFDLPLNLAQTVRQISNVRVPALWAEFTERLLKLEEVVAVQTARTFAPVDMFGEGLLKIRGSISCLSSIVNNCRVSGIGGGVTKVENPLGWDNFQDASKKGGA
ncbi:hypothetical protein F4782DRAFT_230508 [Xylaria castorea]|nr:hypothetical protein F4782DRAFT_230508 [Xylaria castorea]